MANPNAGAYRIASVDFPAPITGWDENPIDVGLDDFPINSSYRTHFWRWRGLPGYWAELLFAAYDNQQTNRTAPASIETDPYDGTGAEETYGTTTYTNVRIAGLSTRTRGLPHYDDVTVTFVIYVS